MTLRDDLAAVLGPGNDDRVAYAQADSVLGVLVEVHAEDLPRVVAHAVHSAGEGPWAPEWLQSQRGVRPHRWTTVDEREEAQRWAEAQHLDVDRLRAEGLLP